MSGSAILGLLFIIGMGVYLVFPLMLAQITSWICGIYVCLLGISTWLKQQRQKLSPVKPSSSVFAVVTGGSGGIGLEIASCLASRGYNLVLVSRNLEKLQEESNNLRKAWGVQVLVVPCDLSVPGASEQLHSDVMAAVTAEAKGAVVDLLVNNAGFAAKGEFLSNNPESSTPLPRLTAMLQLNAVAAVELCRRFGEDMRARGKGRILNVSSIVGSGPGPNNAVYSASKALLTSFSVALHYELQPHGVGVTCLCPGATWTNFGAEAGCDNALVFRLPGMQSTAKAVARYGVEEMMLGTSVATPGLLNAALVFANPIMPRQLILTVINIMWGEKLMG